MTIPHQCRCAICGEIGTITSGLPNVFAAPQVEVEHVPERRKNPIVPTDTFPAPRDDKPYADVPTCTHGYTRCMPCKFPPS